MSGEIAEISEAGDGPEATLTVLRDIQNTLEFLQAKASQAKLDEVELMLGVAGLSVRDQLRVKQSFDAYKANKPR